MIPRYKLDTLTDDEYAILLYGLNNIHPPKPLVEVNDNVLVCYKPDILQHIIQSYIKPALIESGNGSQLCDNIINKLCGP